MVNQAIKFLFKIGRGRVISQQELVEDGKYPVYSSQTQNNGILGYINTFDFDRKQITWTTDGANAGTVFLREGKHSCTNVCGTLQLTDSSQIIEYLNYALQIAAQFYKRPDTNGAKIMNGEMSEIFITLPSLHEQKAIASFLDRTTIEINRAISQKERLIELLQERREILIHNAVTRGLNPNAKMKHSRIDEIGEIPEHWQVVSNFALFEERNEAGREELPILMVSIHTAVSSDEVSDEENIRGKVRIEDKTSYKLVKPGDIVFNMMRAWQGAIGAVTNEGMVSPAYIVAKPKREFSSVFLEFQFRTQDYIQQIDRFSKGITDFRKRLYWNEFKRLKTILPPIEEQRAISEFITNLNEKTERAVAAKRKEIEKLKEYKAVLINSAVTGKIKVCDQIENEEMKANYA